MHKDAPLIKRNGEVNAWDNAEFRAAIKATGKKQIILGGITTDVSSSPLSFIPLVLIFVYTGVHRFPISFACSRRVHGFRQLGCQWHV
jgi:hypothetical protein